MGSFVLMKYNFSINQVAAVGLGDIDVIDCCIIEWLYYLCASPAEKVVSNRYQGHTWVSYKYAIEDMPLLHITSKVAFRKRLLKLIEKGYFSYIKHRERVYVKPLTRVNGLFEERNPRLTAPLTTVNAEKTAVTGVNCKPGLTNPNPYTNTPRREDNRGKDSPTSTRMGELLRSGVHPLVMSKTIREESELRIKARKE